MLPSDSRHRRRRQKDRTMILKVEDSTFPYGWSYFDGLHQPSVSGRVSIVRVTEDGYAVAFLREDDDLVGNVDAPNWSFYVLHCMVNIDEAQVEGDRDRWLAVQWRNGSETHVAVTRRSAYLMSDDGKT